MRFTGPFFILPLLLMLAGCSDRGDFGRHEPSLLSKTYTKAMRQARRTLGANESYDLPLTGAEDALRRRFEDLGAMQYQGIVAQMDHPRSSDEFARIEALTIDLKVERERFARFVEAGEKVMRIDDVRAQRLKGLDALTARRQNRVVKARYRDNDELMRNGARLMRERVQKYKDVLRRLPVETPDVPLDALNAGHEAFREDVVQFHARIDERAHQRLAGGGQEQRYK